MLNPSTIRRTQKNNDEFALIGIDAKGQIGYFKRGFKKFRDAVVAYRFPSNKKRLPIGNVFYVAKLYPIPTDQNAEIVDPTEVSLFSRQK
jgi:hypothetical protein